MLVPSSSHLKLFAKYSDRLLWQMHIFQNSIFNCWQLTLSVVSWRWHLENSCLLCRKCQSGICVCTTNDVLAMRPSKNGFQWEEWLVELGTGTVSGASPQTVVAPWQPTFNSLRACFTPQTFKTRGLGGWESVKFLISTVSFGNCVSKVGVFGLCRHARGRRSECETTGAVVPPPSRRPHLCKCSETGRAETSSRCGEDSFGLGLPESSPLGLQTTSSDALVIPRVSVKLWFGFSSFLNSCGSLRSFSGVLTIFFFTPLFSLFVTVSFSHNQNSKRFLSSSFFLNSHLPTQWQWHTESFFF